MEHELRSHFTQVEDNERRSNIERIVTSYRHPWDIYAELLQNSIDAIFEAKQTLYSNQPEWKGKIKIVVDSERRSLKISDNGIGIPFNRIGAVIVLGRSLKRENRQGSRYGFMGFGLTFVAFQSSYIKIESVYQGQKSSRSYRDLYTYVFKNGELPDAEENATPENVTDSHGTTIYIDFDSAYPRLPQAMQDDLDRVFSSYAENSKLFECILRTRTAVGNTECLFGKKPPCDIEIIAHLNGKEVKVPFRYLDLLEVLKEFNITSIYKLSNFEQLMEVTSREQAAARERKRKVDAIWYTTEEPMELGKVGDKIKANFYIFATSKFRLNDYNTKVLTLESEAVEELSNGVFLSLDGMPTSIRLDSWSHSSYLPFTVIVDAQYLHKDLDAGRKGITHYRAKQLLSEAERLIKEKKLNQYRRHVVDATRDPDDHNIRNAKDLMGEKVDINKTRKGTILSQQWFPPQEEQEVIALFIELVGIKKICGYYLMMLSGYDQYDGLLEYSLKRTEDPIYHPKHRAFGVPDEKFQDEGRIYKKMLVEFKLDLESIYNDVRHNRKDLREIDLIVCWDANEEKIQTRGDELIRMDKKGRVFDGVTHKLNHSDVADEIPVICLKTFLDETGYYPQEAD